METTTTTTTTQIISTSKVFSATHKEPSLIVDLTPWDLKILQFDPIQKGLLFHKPPNDTTATTIDHLKSSLSRALDYFPTLAGRLATTVHHDDTISVYIDCNNAGAEFVHATAGGVSVADILAPIYVPNEVVYSFFPLNGVTNCEGTSKPLLGVQVTELVDGIFIACTINHSVADGLSFWHFFNSWSEICRGLEAVSTPPFIQPWFVNESDRPIRIPSWTIKPTEFVRTPPADLPQRVFHITKENMAKLKEKANAEISNGIGNGAANKVISSLQALYSLFWRAATLSRPVNEDEFLFFLVTVEIRSRLQPPLPRGYFGNAVQSDILIMKAKDQIEKGIGNVALEMNKIINALNDEKIRAYLETWTEKPVVLTWDGLKANSRCIPSGSPRFNVYGNDLGWGKPIAVRSGPASKGDGNLSFYPGVEEGSVDVEVCFLNETLEGMANDVDFMQFIS